MATSVGVTFARLLAHGFSVAGATRVARHRTVVDADYLAVGDGTHVVSQSDDIVPSRYEIERLGDDSVAVVARNFSPRLVGTQHHHKRIASDGLPRLSGQHRRCEMTMDELDAFLSNNNGPFFYDGSIYWTDGLRAELL